MTVEDDVLAAANARAQALGAGDGDALSRLLHPGFRWTSHRGETLDREAYLAANVGGRLRWGGQRLESPAVVVSGDAAVLTALVVDDVDAGAGWEEFRMPMTQTWVHDAQGWRCLAGHAGPRLAAEGER